MNKGENSAVTLAEIANILEFVPCYFVKVNRNKQFKLGTITQLANENGQLTKGHARFHRITEWSRLEGTSAGHLLQLPCSCRATYSQLLRAMSRWVLSISKDGDSTNLFWQPVPVFSHPHSKKVFPDVQREHPTFQFVPIVPCPVTGHQ